MKQNQKDIPANLRRNPATASDMALSFSSTHLSSQEHSFKRYILFTLLIYYHSYICVSQYYVLCYAQARRTFACFVACGLTARDLFFFLNLCYTLV